MRTVNFNTVIPGLNGSGCRCRKVSFDLKNLVRGQLPRAAGQLLGGNRYRACRDRFADPVAARVVELYEGFAPAYVAMESCPSAARPLSAMQLCSVMIMPGRLYTARS